MLIPALAFQRKIDEENTNVHGQAQIQSLQIPGWGNGKRWGYRGEDEGQRSSHFFWGFCCTQLNPHLESSSEFLELGSARFMVAHRGLWALLLDPVLGDTISDLAHVGSASSIMAPGTWEHPLCCPGEPSCCLPTLSHFCTSPVNKLGSVGHDRSAAACAAILSDQ